jgi:hypothetical protein
MLAVLDGAVGRLRGVECQVWRKFMYAHKGLDLNPTAHAACNDFNKKMFSTRSGCINRILRFTCRYVLFEFLTLS